MSYGLRRLRVCGLLLAGVWASATVVAEPVAGPSIEEEAIYDFEDGELPREISGGNARLEVVLGADGKALRAMLAARDNFYTSVTIQPKTPINLTGSDVVGIAMDIHNTSNESVQLNLDVRDGKGNSQTRSTAIPAQGGGTYFAEFSGPALTRDTGLRDDPQDWKFPGHEFHWMWGNKQLDISSIAQLRLVAQSLSSDRQIVIDNIRIVRNPDLDTGYLEGIVDQFGQNAKEDYPGKVASKAELEARAVSELSALAKASMPGRSRWQGWADGPRLEATGYFRTHKVNGKWWLVDPDGYLFFSTGIANVRMANMPTLTGFDYRPGFIEQRDPEDLTPEDSVGPKRIPQSALPGRFVSSELRRDMFEWLPPLDSEFGKHYSYIREVHTGPLKAGETFNFYSANLERKYGDRGNASYLADWQETTKARMIDWGFTSFGNWLDPVFYDDSKVPYFANGWIIGDFKTVSTGSDFWAPLPDPFDPKFTERARATASQIASEVKGNPWCVGVFIDNEKSWGRPESVAQRYAVVINTMARNAADSPTKAAWMKILREKYGNIGKLNRAWGTHVATWDDLAAGVQLTDHNAGLQADYSIMLEAFASEYFRIVDMALDEVMPNHMYMGVRFANWGMSPEVVRAAAKYVDVMSYNEYKEVPHKKTWAFLSEIDKPSIIGEFHVGAIDTLLYHPGLVMVESQADRGRKYADYMNTVIDNPWFVGAHWFQYIDSPSTGRAHDGENYNVGFVDITDTPYSELVDAAREVNRSLYERRANGPSQAAVLEGRE